MPTTTVHELRLVVTTDDLDEAVRVYRDVLGLPERGAVSSPEGRVVILDAGHATLELVDPAHAAYIDEVEVGHPSAGRLRLALRVDDTDTTARQLTDAGVPLEAPPTPTPWGSRNARFAGPPGSAGLQLTLFSTPG